MRDHLLLRSAGYCLSALLLIAVAMTGDAFAAPPSKAVPDPVRSWNLLALQTVRARSLSDAQAARLYAMVNVAMYDAVNAIVAQHGADGRTSALVPMGEAPPNANLDVAAAAAAHAVLSGEFPDLRPEYDYHLRANLVDAGAAGPTEAGQQWGYRVGAAVRAARANDGSAPAETQPAGSGPGQFRAAWSGVQFRNLTPFGIANSTIYRGAGPAALDGLDYASAFAEVKLLGNAALTDPAKLATFQFWSLAAGTAQPPGAWIQVALAVTKKKPPPLPEMARLLALVSMALSDTVAPTVWSKFTFRFWRPATAIREADSDGNALTDPDPSWSPRAGGIGGNPEYWSGHSIFSGAGAAALAGFFCSDAVPFSLTTDSAPDGVARTYPGFSAAAAEAGQSRIFGGIHFGFSNQEGLAAGKAIAEEILATRLLRRRGPTHFGACPL